MLYLYYTNLKKGDEKNKFIAEVMEKCRVGYPTVCSWIKKSTLKGYRIPKPVYRPIISEITGMKEDKLFKN